MQKNNYFPIYLWLLMHITLQKAYLFENLCFFGNLGIIKHIKELILKRTCNHYSDIGSIFEIDKDFDFQEILIRDYVQ